MDYTLEKTAQLGGTTLYDIRYGGHTAQGLASRLPDSPQSMLAIQCAHGVLLCRLYDVEVASRLAVAAAVFSAVDLEDMLAKKPLSLSEVALAGGATTAMTGLELLAHFS